MTIWPGEYKKPLPRGFDLMTGVARLRRRGFVVVAALAKTKIGTMAKITHGRWMPAPWPS